MHTSHCWDTFHGLARLGAFPPTLASVIRLSLLHELTAYRSLQGRRFGALLPHSTYRNISSPSLFRDSFQFPFLLLADLCVTFSVTNVSHSFLRRPHAPTRYCRRRECVPRHSADAPSDGFPDSFRRKRYGVRRIHGGGWN